MEHAQDFRASRSGRLFTFLLITLLAGAFWPEQELRGSHVSAVVVAPVVR
jgi:hypothetical protein